VVLLDIMMETPLSGVNVARKMSADPALAQIPVIMVSSIDSSQYANQLPDDIRIPIDAWISKPVNREHLLRTIQRFVKK
jgi:CheY-like chemotaxis protein